MELKEGEKVGVGKGFLQIRSEEALEGSAQTAIIGDFTENRFAKEEGKGGCVSGEVAEMEWEESAELFGVSGIESAASSIRRCR